MQRSEKYKAEEREGRGMDGIINVICECMLVL